MITSYRGRGEHSVNELEAIIESASDQLMEMLKRENDQIKQLVEQNAELLRGLDLATDLLPVPEHHQDVDWYEKEQQVYEILAKYSPEPANKKEGADE